MPTVQITAQASTDELLRSVASLPAAELEQFVTRVLALRARLKAPTIPDQEANLLHKINIGLSAIQQQRFADLNLKRQEETLTDEEHQELLVLIEEMETEEVTNYAEIMPVVSNYAEPIVNNTTASTEQKTSELTQDELFAKLQNYKKLLDNGLIMQGEYDAFKKEILSLM